MLIRFAGAAVALMGLIVLTLPPMAGAAAFDVRAHGARGDGVAKDTVAIQSAVDSASAVGSTFVPLNNRNLLY